MIRPVRPDGTIETGGVFVPVVRRRVLERMASAAMQRIVLVIAPAGYGKSVALRQFLDSIEEPCVRYDVLPDNGGLLGFLRGFADALSEIAPDARATLAGAYEKNAASDSPGTDLAMWMHAHLKTYRGIIAIDDLHIAQEDREVTRFLASLIERTKGRVQWIIASRTALGLPIGTWLAYGESDLAIDEHDLKFSIEEARDAAKTFRLGVRDEELYELLNLTDGWATAMSFALRSSTRSVDLRNISSMTREMIYRYLAEQVYQGLNEEEREFLETAALLPEIDVDVLVAAGYERAVSIIEDLRQRVAFVNEIGDRLYRLHDLFHDFVLFQLGLRGEVEIRKRAMGIAAVLLMMGKTPQALRVFIDHRAGDEAKQILSSEGIALISRGFADEIAAAVDADLGTSFGEDAIVTGLRGYLQIVRGQVRQGKTQIRRALAQHLPVALRAELTMALVAAEIRESEDAATLLGAILEDPMLPPSKRVEVEGLLCAYEAHVGDIEGAKMRLVRLERELMTIPSDESRAKGHLRAGNVYYAAEEYDAAREALTAAAEIGGSCALWGVVAKAYLNLSLVTFFHGNDAALGNWYAQQAASSATRAGEYLELQSALLVMLSLETRRGNADRALQLEKQLADLRLDDPQRANFIASSQAHRHAWAGRFADAHRLFGAIIDRQVHIQDRLLVRSLHALCLALDGMTRQSGNVVEETSELFLQSRSVASSSHLLLDVAFLMLVLAEVVAGRLTAAGRLVKRWDFASDEVVRQFRNAVDDVVRVAKSGSYAIEDVSQTLDVARERGYGGYVKYVALAAAAVGARRETATSVMLTPSEVRIIRDLAAGLTPKEIAAEMGRSVYTVQTHIQNLIEKLGCHGRAEAISAARRLGYLSSGQ